MDSRTKTVGKIEFFMSSSSSKITILEDQEKVLLPKPTVPVGSYAVSHADDDPCRGASVWEMNDTKTRNRLVLLAYI